MLGFVAVPSPDQLTRLEGDLSNPQITEERLLTTLRRIGIKPFVDEDVEAYKVTKARHETPSNWWLEPVMRHYDGMVAVAVTKGHIGAFAAVLLALGWILSGLMAVAMLLVGHPAIAAVLTVGALSHFFLFKLALTNQTFKGRATWRLYDYHLYRGNVPWEVRALAQQIARRAPGVIIEVDELVQNEMTLDPFLVVSIDGGPRYYVAVWDEDYVNAG